MTKYPYHQNLRLQNFTAFEFVPEINAFIGTNSTGKTHLLKVLYSFQLPMFRDYSLVNRAIEGVFQTREVEDLVRFHDGRASQTLVEGKWANQVWSYVLRPASTSPISHEKDISVGGGNLSLSHYLFKLASLPLSMSRPVFIPSVDMICKHTVIRASEKSLFEWHCA